VATSPHRHIQRAGREALAVVRGETKTHTYLRNRLLAILWVTVALGLASTLVVYFTERRAAGTQIHNLFDAFLYAMSQLLTASSVASPSTNLAKALQLFFDIYAITVVATLAGSFGSFFHRRSHERDVASAAADSIAERSPQRS
jgi:hypothetical protein